jgi:molecular chaperone GrpE
MMSDTEQKLSDSPPETAANDQPEAQAQAEAQTPEQLMAAATARINELEAQLAEMKDRWVRAEAETQNVRARARREVEETRQYAVQKFAADVVEAADNLHRGLAALPAPEPGEPEVIAKMREGLAGVERNFLAILERNGVRREDPTGKPFDPNLHQAMAEQPSGGHPPGTVLQAWTPVWTLNGRLLRPAMVVVSKAAGDPELQRRLNEVWSKLEQGIDVLGWGRSTRGGVPTLVDLRNNVWERDQSGIWHAAKSGGSAA